MTIEYQTKDSGRREQYASGMQRDTQDGKPRFDLMFALDLPFEEQLITRYAQRLAQGVQKYGERNWEKAETQEELDRAKASAVRHFMQWMAGETDEDHASAVVFNLTVAEYVKRRLSQRAIQDDVNRLVATVGSDRPDGQSVPYGSPGFWSYAETEYDDPIEWWEHDD